jgi:hypothetical protein
MILAEAVQIPEKQICSKTITTHIPISFDAVGCPELPTTTMADGHKTKNVQSLLREYCTEHIRESSFYIFAPKYNI